MGIKSYLMHRHVAVSIVLAFVFANGFEHSKFTSILFLLLCAVALSIISFRINPNYITNSSLEIVPVIAFISWFIILVILTLIMHIRKEKELIAAIELNMEYKAKFEGIL